MKASIFTLAPILVILYNYFLEHRCFPGFWCEGLSIALFKAGDRLDPTCYRRLTILPVFEKVFEMIFNKRFEFVNEAFNKIDRLNNGFLKGARCGDNMFILQSVISRQLLMGKPLFVVFVDFSSAFDLVNRHILFFRLIQGGWDGRMLDTMRNIYKQTKFRLRHKGLFSDSTDTDSGVFQGGSASGNLFRKFFKDASDYLDARFGIVIGHTLLAHLLWADDLLLMAESAYNMQMLLNGLFKFCSRNLMIVNLVKTRCMVYGCDDKPELFFNNLVVKIVDAYKYLGNMFSPIIRPTGDAFKTNYDYLCSHAQKAVFALKRSLTNASPTPPAVSLKLFESRVKPILVYGSDNWGLNKTAHETIDLFQRRFLKYVLCVKSSTSNSFIYGETGCLPISLDLSTFALTYFHRLYNMPKGSLVKHVFDEMMRISDLGFSSSVTQAKKKLLSLDLWDSVCLPAGKFADKVKSVLKEQFLLSWHATLSASVARVYVQFKSELIFEDYLTVVKIFRHRVALSRLRCSSHHLSVETGRWSNKKLQDRICPSCRVLDDEEHFVRDCRINSAQRADLSTFIFANICEYSSLAFSNFRENMFLNLLSASNEALMKSFARFCYSSFQSRKSFNE